MNCKRMRVAWLATSVLICANLASAVPLDITLTPAALNFRYQAGAALPASQTLQVKSTGVPLNFTVSTTGPLPYAAQWLIVSANSGTTSASLKVYVNPTGLPSGSYTATIVVDASINSAAPATPIQSFPVTLDVGDAPATLSASTLSLNYSYVTGGVAPVSQAVVLMTTGGALTASITVSGGAWLKASPSGSIALVGLPGAITVVVDPTALAPGSYTGKIVFASGTAANKSVTVNVILTVAAGVPSIQAGGVWPPGTLVTSPATIVTLTGANFFSTSVASIGATLLATTVLSPTTMLVTIPAALMTPAGNLAITIATPTATSPSAPATFVVYAPGPQVWAAANAASYTTSTVSPGAIVTIYGIDLGPPTIATFPGTSIIPTSLPATGPATSVTIDGTPAPLLYTSSTQVSCIVPYAVALKSGTPVDLVLTYNSLSSGAFPVNVVDADPGVFTVNASGTGQGAILNFNATTGDYTVNSSSNAAAKGGTVVIYITGFGATVCANSLTSACVPFANETNLIAGTVTSVAAVTVSIDGQAATVQGAASPIGSVPGVLQINTTVPLTTKAGNAVPVIVSIGPTAKSQLRVTMVVK
jgi:uncharacterized protein (TIGR03437 family)